MAVSVSGVEIEDESHLKPFKSSPWGERLFCDQCGSTLIWRTQDSSHVVISAQAFDDPAAFEFTGQIYVDQKPANYEFANSTREMTEAEVVAMFAPPPEGS